MRWLQHCLGQPLVLAGALLVCIPIPCRAQALPSSSEVRSEGLRPGDVIRLKIWREPDLSGDVLVDEAGIAIFPKIGPYTVTDDSPESLKIRLTAAYQEVLRNPSIEIRPMRRVNILGGVRSPGLYPVDATMTLADALALAGGATPQGDPDKIDLVRAGRRIRARLSQHVQVGELPIQSGDQVYVPERSWVSRNSGVVASAISASVSLVIALFIRR